MKNSSSNHTLVISPDWDHMRSVQRDGITYTFATSDKCPGYTIQISNWRLRKKSGTTDDITTLLEKADRQLEHFAGDSGFSETKRVKAEIALKAQTIYDSVGILRPDWQIRIHNKRKEFLEEAQRDMTIALIKDRFSPRIAPLSFSLISLIMRDKADYVVESIPWSFTKPPRALQHLADTGFNSRFGRGILALPAHGNDVWVVSKFSECEVELSWDRAAAITKEFPLISELSSLKESMVKATEALSDIPPIIAEKERLISEQHERLAFMQQVITSSVRTSLELTEQKIVRRRNELCLHKLSEEELLLFLFLIGYQWKKEQKKVFSKRKICWALGLGSDPHPEIISRKEADLRDKYLGIGPLIDAYRAQNIKGERRDKRREISYEGMDDTERRRLGLDDGSEGG